MRSIYFLPDTVAFTRHQRHRHSISKHDRPHLIGDAAAHIDGILYIGGAGKHDARAGMAHVVERWFSAVGTGGAVARCARINELRIARAEVLVAQAQTIGYALAEVLHEDVALLDEFVDDFARGWFAQVNRHTVLVPIIRLEVEIEALFGGVG